MNGQTTFIRNPDQSGINIKNVLPFVFLLCVFYGWLRGSVVERRSLTGELSLSCARPAADG